MMKGTYYFYYCYRVTPSAPVSALTSTSMNYVQLEEIINKWTLELEEQEKLFVNQATQINAWDRLLVNNSEKVYKNYILFYIFFLENIH